MTTNMVGKRCGRLTAVEEAGRDKHHNILWKCVCECGNVVVVRGSNLRNGDTKSCGCLQRERASETQKIDLYGQRFGRLMVIDEAGHNKGHDILWKCICDCGNETIVDGSSLRKGHTKSCGCYMRERVSETHIGKEVSMEVRIRRSCTLQHINSEDWDGFKYLKNDWRDYSKAVYLNAPFPGCHRHHITETLVACIPIELHRHIKHCLKTGYNMGETNMLALQYINGGLDG